jgi:hypothetical protein
MREEAWIEVSCVCHTTVPASSSSSRHPAPSPLPRPGLCRRRADATEILATTSGIKRGGFAAFPCLDRG